jgi:hypothetical protein
LFRKDGGEDFCGRLTTLQEGVSMQDQFLDQRLALMPTRFPNGFEWGRPGCPFFR